MCQMSCSGSFFLNPTILESGPAPSTITLKISPSVEPCTHVASVRSGGWESFGARGPLPFASALWQKANGYTGTWDRGRGYGVVDVAALLAAFD